MNLSVRDASALLRVSEKTIYRWIQQQTIPFFKVHGSYRFHRAEILEWATSSRKKVSSEVFNEPEARLEKVPDLASTLEKGGIYYRVDGHDRESVLRQVAQLIRLPEEVDRKHLLDLVLAREVLSSTGVGDGIAIPHVRNPVLLHVNRPTLALCFLERPIDYAALDGQPVGILFPLFSPTIKAHLVILSRLSFVLRSKEMQEVLRGQGSREEVLTTLRRIESELVSETTLR